MNSSTDSLLQKAIDALGLTGAELVNAETRATDTLVWQVRHEDRLLAIRVMREDQAQVAEIECHAIDLARDAGVPAPTIIATGVVDGTRPAMAIEWLDGEPVGEILLRLPRLACRLGTQAGAMMARIHAVNHPALPGSDNWIGRGTQNDPELEHILNAVSTGPASLLHLDFHPFNLIVRGGRITGVLDWTNSAIGDPRADVARTLCTMQISAPAFLGEYGARRMTIGLFAREFVREYQRHRGPLEQMAPFFVWAANWMLRDIGPKIDRLPVADPGRMKRRIIQSIEHHRKQVLPSQ
jgi:aminoglycoside phosphotransferase (APT) family kinase protein